MAAELGWRLLRGTKGLARPWRSKVHGLVVAKLGAGGSERGAEEICTAREGQPWQVLRLEQQGKDEDADRWGGKRGSAGDCGHGRTDCMAGRQCHRHEWRRIGKGKHELGLWFSA